MKRFVRRLNIVVAVGLFLVGIYCAVEATYPDWICQGTPQYWPDWHYNHDTGNFDHSWGQADVKGDQESADFCCVCHDEEINPDRDYTGYAQCDYYGPLWYDYAHNDASFWVRYDSQGPYYKDGELSVWVYCD